MTRRPRALTQSTILDETELDAAVGAGEGGLCRSAHRVAYATVGAAAGFVAGTLTTGGFGTAVATGLGGAAGYEFGDYVANQVGCK